MLTPKWTEGYRLVSTYGRNNQRLETSALLSSALLHLRFYEFSKLKCCSQFLSLQFTRLRRSLPNMEQAASSQFVPIFDEKAFTQSSSCSCSDFHKSLREVKRLGWAANCQLNKWFSLSKSENQKKKFREISFCFWKVPMNSLFTIVRWNSEDSTILSPSHENKHYCVMQSQPIAQKF